MAMHDGTMPGRARRALARVAMTALDILAAALVLPLVVLAIVLVRLLAAWRRLELVARWNGDAAARDRARWKDS